MFIHSNQILVKVHTFFEHQIFYADHPQFWNFPQLWMSCTAIGSVIFQRILSFCYTYHNPKSLPQKHQHENSKLSIVCFGTLFRCLSIGTKFYLKFTRFSNTKFFMQITSNFWNFQRIWMSCTAIGSVTFQRIVIMFCRTYHNPKSLPQKHKHTNEMKIQNCQKFVLVCCFDVDP